MAETRRRPGIIEPWAASEGEAHSSSRWAVVRAIVRGPSVLMGVAIAAVIAADSGCKHHRDEMSAPGGTAVRDAIVSVRVATETPSGSTRHRRHPDFLSGPRRGELDLNSGGITASICIRAAVGEARHCFPGGGDAPSLALSGRPCFQCSVWDVPTPAAAPFDLEVWNGRTLECRGRCSLGQTCSFPATQENGPCVVAIAIDHTVDLSNATLRCPWQKSGLCPQ